MDEVPTKNTPKNANNNPPNNVSVGSVKGPSTVEAGSTASYTCSYSTPQGTFRGSSWSLASGDIGSMNRGTYTAPDIVTADTDITVKFTIWAGRPFGQSWSYGSRKTVTVLANAGMFIGDDVVSRTYLGDTAVDKAMIGETQVF